jgi:tetratricopeptide (TPR) repeat protein
MNYYMFPAHSNSARRLRRTSASVENTVLVRSAERSEANLSLSSIADDQAAAPSPTFSESANYLSVADREMLLRQQAIDKAQQGQKQEAIKLFSLLIRHNPGNAGNYNNRGLLYFQEGQHLQALADYDQALKLNSQLAKVYNNRANCYAALGDLEAAIADYETAIDLDPTDIRTRLNQGITFRELNLFESAIESFDLALQISQFLNSTDEMMGVPAALEGHVYAERGRTYHYLGDWNFAVADYHRALARLPFSENSFGASSRLRGQVQTWLNDLLSPVG